MWATYQRLMLSLAFVALNAFTFQAQADQSTFQKFGEKPGLVRIMDDFMVNLLDDPRTRPFFIATDQARIKVMLVDQMCELLGGGCEYRGRDMKSSHAHLDIDRGEFNALVESFQLAMDKNGVPFSAQNILLSKLAPMYRDIETEKAAK